MPLGIPDQDALSNGWYPPRGDKKVGITKRADKQWGKSLR